ncbi:MAG TPA: thiamine pyrophosphate-binding protein [Polyangia bacterium]|jgi:acetolactate synthase-1/2/3 large subunit|nr:thiamine pyrophosphate-binding protein [Polyangia bacterium]
MTLADALAATLADWDCRYVFGVSGANIEHLHDAIHRAGRLQSVMARSEVGAAFMADARARIHRTLGVCCATSGGGMMNLAVGLAESYAESVPVLGIVGQVPTTLEGRGGFQDGSGIGRTVDALGLFRALTKHVARIDRPADFWPYLEQAVTAALSGRPGPAVLLVPRDMWAQPVGPRPPSFPARLDPLRVPAALDDTAGVDRLFAAMRDARRPLLLVGTGVERSSAPDEVRRFAVAAQIPVVTTMGNVAAFPHDHPLFVGVVGAAGHPSAHDYLNDEADLIVAVGSGLDVMTRAPLARGLTRAAVALVNIDAAQARRTLEPALVVEADAGLVFARLNACLAERPFRHAPVEGYALRRYRIQPIAAPLRPEATRNDGLRSSVAVEILQRYLPERGHVLFDAGNCAATALHLLSMRGGASTTIALGQGGMGYAIAAATGAQLGSARDERTLVICGDGAFLMLGTEVHTAVDLGLRVLFVVFNDNQHGMCVTRQRLYFDARLECSRYATVDIAAVARGLGPGRLWVGSASSPAQLLAQLAAYHADGGARPGVLEVRLQREEMPPFAPFLPEDAETCVAAWNASTVSSAA